MNASYRGYEIDVKRERCMAGYNLVYYSIFRESDGFECVSNFTDSSETVEEVMQQMKEMVDQSFLEDDPWGE